MAGHLRDSRAPVPVAYVIASMVTGGTQTHLLQVFRFLNRTRFRPVLFALRDAGDLLDAARGAGVDVRTFGMSGSLKNPRDLVGLGTMTRALRELAPGVLHGYLLRANFYGALAARVAGVPVVVTSKRGQHRPSGFPERFATRVSNRLSTVVTGNSEQVLRFTRAEEAPFAAPMVMIPSGIDTARFDPAAVDRGAAARLRDELGLGDAPVIGTAMTFRPKKGFPLLFEAMAALLRSRPDAVVLFAGEDSMSPEAAALADRFGIRDRFRLLGRRDDMPEVLSSCDVFVLPSESEGMSNAILEAMAMQKPVVVTAVGGAPEMIEEGRQGFLVDYPDANAMAARLDLLLGDAALRERVGAAARRRVVEAYSAEAMVGQMENLYLRLLGGKKA